MTRLACLRAAVIAGAFFGGAGAAGTAHASSPLSIYVGASSVTQMPDEATATSVGIRGAFILLKSDGSWAAPQCGYMYFKCPAGSEAMCRMQWRDVITYGTPAQTCAGFGTLNVTTTATIRTEGTALASPDDWDLGMGVMIGSSLSGQCPIAKALACAQPTGGGGGGGGGATGA